MNTNFYSEHQLTRQGIEPESTVSIADALSTRPLIRQTMSGCGCIKFLETSVLMGTKVEKLDF